MVRHPAVAGSFYPAKPEVLLDQLQQFTANGAEKIDALGCVVPHAGYMYSGHVAGRFTPGSPFPNASSFFAPTTPDTDSRSPSTAKELGRRRSAKLGSTRHSPTR